MRLWFYKIVFLEGWIQIIFYPEGRIRIQSFSFWIRNTGPCSPSCSCSGQLVVLELNWIPELALQFGLSKFLGSDLVFFGVGSGSIASLSGPTTLLSPPQLLRSSCCTWIKLNSWVCTSVWPAAVGHFCFLNLIRDIRHGGHSSLMRKFSTSTKLAMNISLEQI